MTNLRQIMFWFGCALLLVATLPLLGVGRGVFFIPGVQVVVPRAQLFAEHEALRRLVELPLRKLVEFFPSLAQFVYFPGEGVITMEPFAMTLFYSSFGSALMLFALCPMNPMKKKLA